MDITVYPGRAEGVVAAPPCINEAKRAIVLASITLSGVRGSGLGNEIQELLGALSDMGAQYRIEDSVILFYKAPQSSKTTVTCSLETAVLLLPLCAALGGEYTFFGRFESCLADALEGTGAELKTDGTGITVKGKISTKEIIVVDEKMLTGFLLALPLLEDIKINFEGNKAQADFALQILKDFGYAVNETDGYRLKKDGGRQAGYAYNAGGDYGEAVYYMLSGFVSGEVGVTGLLADTAQPKRKIIEELKRYKLNVQELYGAVFAKRSRMRAEVIDIAASAAPCAVLLLACLGRGKCVIKNFELLQANVREEFEAACSGLKGIGADIMKIGSDVFVEGKAKLFGGRADAQGNRRLSLVFAAAALNSETGVKIENCADISEIRALGISL